MLDRKAVILQVKQGNYPANWIVYCGRGNYGCSIALWICTLFLILIAILQLLFTTAYGFDASSFIGTLLLYGIPLALCITFAHFLRSKADLVSRSLMVILPDGVVQCYADDLEHLAWLFFPGIKRLVLAQETKITGIDGDIFTNTQCWLDVYSTNGTYHQWYPKDCFGDKAYILKSIIAAYNHYW